MNLLTLEIEKKFREHPIGSQDGLGDGAEVLVKYFNPYGAGTWLITEAEPYNGDDWLMFGYCHIYEWEWGYVTLSELEGVRPLPGLGIERDLYIGEHPKVRDLVQN